MMPTAAELPDDIDTLKAMVLATVEQRAAMEAENSRIASEIAALKLINTTSDARIAELTAIVKTFERMLYGTRSERLRGTSLDDEQIDFVFDEIETGVAAIDAELETAAKDKPKRAPRPRKGFAPHLERIEQVIEPEVPPGCEDLEKVLIGEDVSERLDVTAAKFRVIVTRRPKYAWRGRDGVIQAPAPPHIVESGIPSEALLAQIAVAKYADGLPLYRQCAIYARQGIDLDRSTLGDWVGRMAALLDPLVQAIGRHVCAGSVLHADDTTVQVLAPGQGRTRTGRLWALVRDERAFAGTAAPAAFYRYSPDRRAEHAEALLRSCRGFLHADGYAGFNSLFAQDPNNDKPRLTEVACWAHARRNIYEVYDSNGSPLAREALERIAELFEIETRINGRTPQQRLAVRQQEAVPLLSKLESYLNNALGQISGKSTLAKAIRYALSRWAALTRYTTDGCLEMTNNAVERAIRPLAMTRKNYLFAGSDSGGARAAAMYTLTETAKMNGLDPEAYLRDLLARVPDHPINRIGELLPWNWRPTG